MESMAGESTEATVDQVRSVRRWTPLPGTVAAIRRSTARSVGRLAVLLVSDLATFVVAREAMELVRDAALLGSTAGRVAHGVFPSGSLDGWQLAFAVLVGLAMVGAYGRGDRRRGPTRLLLGVTIASVLFLWSTFWSDGSAGTAVRLLGMIAYLGAAFVAVRLAMDWLIVRLAAMPPVAERALFVGDPNHPGSAQIFRRLVERGGMNPIAWVWDGTANGSGDGVRVISTERYLRALRLARPDTVVLCGPLPDGHFTGVVEAAAVAGCRVLAVSRYQGAGQLEPAVIWERGLPFFELAVPALRAQRLAVKRAVDIVLSAVGLVLVAPLFLVIGVAIKLDSPGPVFFRQERVGRGGRRFRVVKFRTMYDGAPQDVHREYVRRQLAGSADAPPDGDDVVFKLVADDRVTRVGRLLRQTSLDEVPQLINVLRGQMSLVGPRPPLPYEVEAYEAWQFERLKVTPGITGLWQVSGRSRLTYRQMCAIDLEYVKRWSLALDLKILVKTIPVVLFNSGRAA